MRDENNDDVDDAEETTNMARGEGPVTIEAVEAENFARGGGPVPENTPKLQRPAPPVGHFGYTQEDADKVVAENNELGATVAHSEVGFDIRRSPIRVNEAGAGIPVETSKRERQASGERRQDPNAEGLLPSAVEPVREGEGDDVGGQPAGQQRSGSQTDGDRESAAKSSRQKR